MRVRQIAQMVRGRSPRIPLLVTTIIENDSPRPRLQAKCLGFADTHCTGRPRTRTPARAPIGL
jgi:hypothetical protein